MTHPLLELSGVVKDYRALRPLRVRSLALSAGERVAVLGLDQVAAEVLINLITGALLPDSGDVTAFGLSTSAIGTGEEWLASADRFGIVSERAVLLDALSVVQNLAVPFTLEIEPPTPEIRERAEQLAAEVGLPPEARDRRVGDLGPELRARVRLARGLALDPEVLLVEHPTSGVPQREVAPLARQIRFTCERRQVALLTLTADQEFAQIAATRVLALEPATGRLSDRTPRGWFGRRAQ